MKKRGGFPLEIKAGSSRVKIYRLVHSRAKNGYIYSVAWYIGPERRQKQFTNLDRAKRFAKERAKMLASGETVIAGVSRSDLAELEEARRISGQTPLLSAIQEWAKAKDICDGDLIPAARFWSSRNQSKLKRISIAEAVPKFVDAKRRQGVDVKASYLRAFPRFEKQFADMPISIINSQMLQDWLDSEFAHPVTRNTVRKRLVTLFRWARKQGYLPRDATTEIEHTEAAREPATEIGIISPSLLNQAFELVHSKTPYLLPSLAIASQCGLRRSEVHKQNWEDIDLERKILRVSAAKTNTPAKRLVPVCDALVKTLQHFQGEGGISKGHDIDRARKLCRDGGLVLPENCFRHSFITYRCALTGDIPSTSLEAGNSVRIVHQHYRELATKEDGVAWFNVSA